MELRSVRKELLEGDARKQRFNDSVVIVPNFFLYAVEDRPSRERYNRREDEFEFVMRKP